MLSFDTYDNAAKIQSSGVHSSINTLCISGPATTFCIEGESIDVPPAIAQRSTLIDNLRQQANEAETMPVPLDDDCIRSWLACCSALVAISEDVSPADLRSMSDETLLQALTAADFLCDASTIASLVEALGRVVLPDAEVHPHKPPSEPASQAGMNRAAKIVRALPQLYVLRMLASIHQRFQGLGDGDQHTLRLLQRLPRTFHPAVFQTCCRTADGSPSFFAGTAYGCCVSCADRMEACDVCPDGPNPDCLWRDASPVFQLLAAAAPLAGGSLAAAWDPDGGADDPRASAEESARPPPAKRVCAMPRDFTVGTDRELSPSECEAQAWSAPHGASAPMSLRVHFNTVESPRWCRALAQLRHLQHLAVTLPDIFLALGAKLAAVLPQLPALRGLAVTCDEDKRSGGTPLLLEAIAACTQLQSLDVQIFAQFTMPHDEAARQALAPQGPNPDTQAMLQLSRLSALTCLTLGSNSVTHGWASAAAAAVKQMLQLQSLSLTLYNSYIDTGDLEHLWAAEELAVEVFAAPQLTSLRHVRLTEFLLGDRQVDIMNFGAPGAEEPQFADMLPISRFRDRALEAGGEALTRLTALDMRNNGIEGEVQGWALAALLTDMPALRSLDLSQNSLFDAGFISLATVLRAGGLRELRRLAVNLNQSEAGGVLELVEAVGDAVAAGAPGVQELDLSHNVVGPALMHRFAEAIQRCRGLQVLQLKSMDLDLTQEGLGLLLGALQALPRLRLVCLAGNRELFHSGWRLEPCFARQLQPLAAISDAVCEARAADKRRAAQGAPRVPFGQPAGAAPPAGIVAE